MQEYDSVAFTLDRYGHFAKAIQQAGAAQIERLIRDVLKLQKENTKEHPTEKPANPCIFKGYRAFYITIARLLARRAAASPNSPANEEPRRKNSAPLRLPFGGDSTRSIPSPLPTAAASLGCGGDPELTSALSGQRQNSAFSTPLRPKSEDATVFEAPIDLMSFCTFYPDAAALCGLYSGPPDTCPGTIPA